MKRLNPQARRHLLALVSEKPRWWPLADRVRPFCRPEPSELWWRVLGEAFVVRAHMVVAANWKRGRAWR